MYRMMRYSLSESFNVVRWCLLVITVSFVSIVSVAKYIQLADLTSITYASLEVTYLILNDPTNIVYIYLPLYLFLISGMMFDDNFGSLEVIKCGSRFKWVMNKFLTLTFYTIIFFIVLVGMNFIIANQVFPYSNVWSADFLRVQVLSGQEVKNFVYSPLMTIGLSVGSVFFMYFSAGTVSMMVSLIANKEVYSLLSSLIFGIGITALFLYGLEITKAVSVLSFTVQNGILLIVSLCITLVSIYIASVKDFQIQKK
ncbi:MAG: hypothetical protein ACRCSG_07220 [Cellulosilyticaceae bacterium]